MSCTYGLMYMKQVSNLLQCIRGTRDRNWLSHLTSLEKMCVAFNRHDYTQNILDHIAKPAIHTYGMI